jgi:dynactin-5
MKIGNFVKIGKDCIIGQRVVIGECSIVLDGSIVTADTQIAPFSVYGGKPALYMG